VLRDERQRFRHPKRSFTSFRRRFEDLSKDLRDNAATKDDEMAASTSYCGRDLIAELRRTVARTRPTSSRALSTEQMRSFMVVDSAEVWDMVLPRMREEAKFSALVSFDLEWDIKDAPRADRPVFALIGTGDGNVYLLYLSKLGLKDAWFPEGLGSLLSEGSHYVVGSGVEKDVDLLTDLDPDKIIDTRAALKWLRNMRLLDDNNFVRDNKVGIGHQALAAWDTIHAYNKCGNKQALEKSLGKGKVPKTFLSDPYRDPQKMYRWGKGEPLTDRQKVYLHVDAQAPIALLQFGAATLMEANATAFDGLSFSEVYHQLYHRVIGTYFDKSSYLVKSVPDFLKDTQLGWALYDRLPKPEGWNEPEPRQETAAAEIEARPVEIDVVAEIDALLESDEPERSGAWPEADRQPGPSRKPERFSTGSELRKPALPEAESGPRRALRLDRLRAFSLRATRVGKIGSLLDLSMELLSRMGEKKIGSRFSHMPGFATGTCFRCGGVGHDAELCPTSAEQKCDYCQRAGHLVAACPTLHHVCAFCALRGHETGRGCPEFEQLEAYRDHFEAFADYGVRTRERWNSVELGLWWFDPRWAALRFRPTYQELLKMPVNEARGHIQYFEFARRLESEVAQTPKRTRGGKNTVTLTREVYEELLQRAQSTPAVPGGELSPGFSPSPVDPPSFTSSGARRGRSRRRKRGPRPPSPSSDAGSYRAESGSAGSRPPRKRRGRLEQSD
jgi:hypothetical protein